MKFFPAFLAALLAATAIRGYDTPFAEADDDRDGRLSPDEFIQAEAIHDRRQVGDYVSDTCSPPG